MPSSYTLARGVAVAAAAGPSRTLGFSTISMARQLWLLRHADAEPHGARADAERRLTERGEEQSRLAGIALRRLGASFEAVLFSPRVRASQTIALAAEGWEEEQRRRIAVHAPLAGGFEVSGARELLSTLDPDGQLLLVGHEPDLSGVVAELTGARVDLKKGGVAVVRLDSSRGELVALMRPRELTLIAAAPPRG
jgi:phosphohistidine phosphatase